TSAGPATSSSKSSMFPMSFKCLCMLPSPLMFVVIITPAFNIINNSKFCKYWTAHHSHEAADCIEQDVIHVRNPAYRQDILEEFDGHRRHKSQEYRPERTP